MWVLIASGSYLGVLGLLEYRESHAAQDEIAQKWNEQAVSETQVSAPAPTKAGVSQESPEQNQLRPVRNPPPDGSAVAKLIIPTLDTVLYVVEGTGAQELKRGPGHLIGTVLPGEEGNCVIAGHRDTHFRVLKDIHRGDEVILQRNGQSFRYRVDGMTIVSPTNTASLRPTSTAELNLITCYPFHYVGSAPKRFIVHAGLEGSSPEASE